MKRASIFLVCLSLVVMVLSGCSRRQQEWEKAHKADTAASYQTFLKDFPNGEFSSQAQARIKELEEDKAWEQAQAANTAEGYQQFLNQYPQGRNSDEARIRIENFALSQAPSGQPAMTAQTDTAPGEAFPAEPAMPVGPAPSHAETNPKPVPKKPASSSPPAPKPQATAGSGYRIQLGAFSGGDKQAMGEWRRLQRDYPKFLGSLNPSVKVITTSSGHLYRLQAGMTNEKRAREICAALKAKKQSCVVVLP